jgi:type IV secretory pathway protease TraF
MTAASAAIVLALTMAWKPPLWLIWNASASVPIGLYKCSRAEN